MKVLGIETSCDETGIAIYDSEKGLLDHVLHTQTATHLKFGGVVPELASRDHVCKTISLVDQLLQQTGLTGAELDGVAYTAGPGLAGALLVGAMIGRSLAFAWGKPAVSVHHLEGHLLACMLEKESPTWPFLALLVSGGHTQLVKVMALGRYEVIGDTLDDAVGEAFDKTAKLLGLGYPGGARLAALAAKGDPKQFHFPRPMLDRPGLAFSFSGLKTAVARMISAELDEASKANIASAFQEAVVETLVVKCKRALQQTGLKRLVVAGGVGANTLLREKLQDMVKTEAGGVYFPRLEFCTDNGAMIAYAGCQRLLAGRREGLVVQVHPRWKLEDC